jgi:Raf kinase inhibitor-like YbhB/YbcL family protein
MTAMRLAPRAAAALSLSIALGACSGAGQASSGQPATGQPAAASTPVASSTEVSPMSASPSSAPSPAGPSSTPVGPFSLISSAIRAGDAVPREFTCDGANISPPLAWTGVPAGSAALVLLVDDPDARDFVHWIVLDLPGADGSLPKGVAPSAASPQQGRNDFGDAGWGGPCPPSGTHHYRFTLFALGAKLGLGGHPGGDAVRKALRGANALGKATLTATYRRG